LNAIAAAESPAARTAGRSAGWVWSKFRRSEDPAAVWTCTEGCAKGRRIASLVPRASHARSQHERWDPQRRHVALDQRTLGQLLLLAARRCPEREGRRPPPLRACDGTSVTNCIERAGGQRPGCMAHARRRFVEAARADDLALEAVRRIAPLFQIEGDANAGGGYRRAASCSTHGAQQAHPRYIGRWLDSNVPSCRRRLLSDALSATCIGNGSVSLCSWEDGNLELTNNRREHELRRLVLGRRSWLFTWLDEGAERTASILSIIGTCIAREVNPRAYLHL
jgi:hypothetical protein